MNTLVLFLALWHPPAWIVHAANVAAAAADIETTQSCLRSGRCRESNPLMPSNRAGAYAAGIALAGVEAAIAEHERRRGHRVWWLSPLASAGVHTGAAISNVVRFR